MGDPYLSAIIDRVESQGDPVSIALALKSGAVLSGYVRQSQFFVNITRRELDAARSKLTPVKDDFQAGLVAQTERNDAALERLDDATGESDFITLSDVKMVWSSGDGLNLQTVRVSLDAIAAWWVLPGQAIQGKKDASGFWAVGVAF
jgi:hypothetical protein